MSKHFNKITILILGLFLLIVFIIACAHHHNFKRNYKDVNSLIHDNINVDSLPFLKAHTINGEVYIFNKGWIVDTLHEKISGTGKIYDFHRNLKFDGKISLE